MAPPPRPLARFANVPALWEKGTPGCGGGCGSGKFSKSKPGTPIKMPRFVKFNVLTVVNGNVLNALPRKFDVNVRSTPKTEPLLNTTFCASISGGGSAGITNVWVANQLNV